MITTFVSSMEFAVFERVLGALATTVDRGTLQTFIEKELRHDIAPTNDPIDSIDAIVDIAYYIYDTTLQFGHVLDEHAEQVKEFTEAARQLTIPTAPMGLSTSKTLFLTQMVVSECMEGLQVWHPAQVALERALNAIEVGSSIECLTSPWQDIVMDCKNSTSSNMTLSRQIFKAAFDEVHSANLRKGERDSDGRLQFVFKDVNGEKKISKPTGWVGPDLHSALAEWYPK